MNTLFCFDGIWSSPKPIYPSLPTPSHVGIPPRQRISTQPYDHNHSFAKLKNDNSLSHPSLVLCALTQHPHSAIQSHTCVPPTLRPLLMRHVGWMVPRRGTVVWRCAWKGSQSQPSVLPLIMLWRCEWRWDLSMGSRPCKSRVWQAQRTQAAGICCGIRDRVGEDASEGNEREKIQLHDGKPR
jgi:hypothetical protein